MRNAKSSKIADLKEFIFKQKKPNGELITEKDLIDQLFKVSTKKIDGFIKWYEESIKKTKENIRDIENLTPEAIKSIKKIYDMQQGRKEEPKKEKKEEPRQIGVPISRFRVYTDSDLGIATGRGLNIQHVALDRHIQVLQGRHEQHTNSGQYYAM